MQRVCVFCGSSAGGDPIHAQAQDYSGRDNSIMDMLEAKGVVGPANGSNFALAGETASASVKSARASRTIIPGARASCDRGSHGIRPPLGRDRVGTHPLRHSGRSCGGSVPIGRTESD